jgi:hypothetical protein
MACSPMSNPVYKEDLCHSSGDINRLMMIMMMMDNKIMSVVYYSKTGRRTSSYALKKNNEMKIGF